MLIRFLKVIALHQLSGVISRKNEIYQILGLFCLLAISFPLAHGGGLAASEMAKAGIAALWLGMLVIGVVSSHLYFDSDWNDGTLEILAQKPGRIGVFSSSIFAVHTLVFGVPVCVLATLLGVMLESDFDYKTNLTGFSLAFLSVSAMTQLMASITVGLRQRSAIVGLLLLPMLMPVTILGGIISFMPDTNAASQALMGLSGLAFLYVPLSLWLSAIALESAIKR